MIIEYTREARCKDCKYCVYYYPANKDGSKSRRKRHKCRLIGLDTQKNAKVCDKWEISYSGEPEYEQWAINKEKNK